MHNLIFLQFIACDILKCGYSSWGEAFFSIEGKREEYLGFKKEKKSNAKRMEELFRLERIRDIKVRQKAFNDSLKVRTFNYFF